MTIEIFFLRMLLILGIVALILHHYIFTDKQKQWASDNNFWCMIIVFLCLWPMHTAMQNGNIVVYRVFLTLQWICIYTQLIGLVFNAKKLKKIRKELDAKLESMLVDTMSKEIEELKKIDNDSAKEMITIYESIINTMKTPPAKSSLWTRIKIKLIKLKW